MPAPPTIELPTWRAVVRHAAPAVVEGSVIPFAIFLVALRASGIHAALLTGLAYAYGRIWWRRRRGAPTSAILLMGALTLTARTAVTLLTGSTLVYFLQPSFGSLLTGGAFGLSAGVGRPLAARFTSELLPLPGGLLSHAPVHRFFSQVSLLWGAVQLAHAALNVWLLTSMTTGTYLVVRTVGSWVLTVGAFAVSFVWFRRSMRRSGLRVVAATVAPCRD